MRFVLFCARARARVCLMKQNQPASEVLKDIGNVRYYQ